MCTLSLRLYGTGQDKPDQSLGSEAEEEVRELQEMAWAHSPGVTPDKPGKHQIKQNRNKGKARYKESEQA